MLLSPTTGVLAWAQSNNCNISTNALLWKRLETHLETLDAGEEVTSALDGMYSMAATLAYLMACLVVLPVDHKVKLTSEEKGCAPCFAEGACPEMGFLMTLAKSQAKSVPFSPATFSRKIWNRVSILHWQKSQCCSRGTSQELTIAVLNQYLTAPSFSTGMERVF